MQDMDLKGVDLNTAVNAVIGSMVTHGYLSQLDNAILVTVSNDSISKAQGLRYAVVNDIRNTLEEKQLKAVVYDQQVMEEDEVKQLADEYKISYGKAYFLRELILQNNSLSMDDMKSLAPLTMEEIAKEITERSYAVSGKTDAGEETIPARTTQVATETVPETITESPVAEESSTAVPSSEATQAPTQATQTQPTAATEATTAEETTSEAEVVTTENIKVDYVDYDNGVVMVYFKTKVKWKNPTVSVKDEDEKTYSAKVGDTDSYSCEIHVTGLQGGMEYTFTLGGISPKIGKQTTVKGIFETPVIGDGNADPDLTEEESEETKPTEQTEPAKESPSETTKNATETGNNSSKEEPHTIKYQEEPATSRSSS